MPYFQPKDLIYLFIGYNKNDSNNKVGPLLKNSYSIPNNFVKNLQELLSTDLQNSTQCSIAIAQNIIKFYTKETSPLSNDFQGIMKILNNHKSINAINLAIKVMDILALQELSLYRKTYKYFWKPKIPR